MAQLSLDELLSHAQRLGVEAAFRPVESEPITRVEIAELTEIERLPPGTLAVIGSGEQLAPYRIDIALRQAGAHRLAGLAFGFRFEPTDTAIALARRGRIPILVADGIAVSELVVNIDRVITGGESATMARAAYAIERVTALAARADHTMDDLLTVAADTLNSGLRIVDDQHVSWSDSDAVCVGDVPIGRLITDADDDIAATVALPVIAALLSRASQRELRDRFAPNQSRADLIIELILAEASRAEGFVGPAARLGLPLQHSHAVAWLRPVHLTDRTQRPARTVQPALELFALQLVESRDELWHIAFLSEDAIIVSTEETGSGDHQRRLREVATRVQERARTLAGSDWTYTLGLGTPQPGATGLRQSAVEARVAAESAIAAGRPGSVELTDVTGLRRVLLDFYASPSSRSLLADILRPLDSWEPQRATTAVQTLLAYLSHRNSLARAGETLNLHPNAVSYRLRPIREALQLDLDDPDVRFAVELACRVRLLV